MRRGALFLGVALFMSIPLYSKPSNQRSRPETWYEQALRQINPKNIHYGAIWEERKRVILGELGNRYFQYSVASTAVIVVLLILLSIQHRGHGRSLDVAAESIADVLRHDESSRRIARDAIQRYNQHMEACNRSFQMKQDGLFKSLSDIESELERVRRQLADTSQENRALRDDHAKHQKVIADLTARLEQTTNVQKASEPGHLSARIAALEKELRAEQRKNQHSKGTSVHDHRA